MDLKFVLDTNAVIYILNGKIVGPAPAGECMASVITEIELLSFPSLDKEAEAGIHHLLAAMTIVPLTDAIRDYAITLRRRHRLKLPDAIIAATALVMNAEPVSNDEPLDRVTEIRRIPLALKS